MSGGQYLMLFMVALLLLWLADDPDKKEFRGFSLVMLLLLLCPLSVRLLSLYQTAFYEKDALWQLLPVTALLAYGLVMAFTRMTAVLTRGYGRWHSAASRQKERLCEIAVGLVLTILLFLCGTLSPAREISGKGVGSGVPGETEEVLSLLEIPEEMQIYLLAPDEIQTWARIYNGNLLLPYGRNLWENELSAYTYDIYETEQYELHDWINGTDAVTRSPEQQEEIISRCASAGYEYLVFSAERAEEEGLRTAFLRQKEYALFAETAQYVIYRRI